MISEEFFLSMKEICSTKEYIESNKKSVDKSMKLFKKIVEMELKIIKKDNDYDY